jgi:hypothetical protein
MDLSREFPKWKYHRSLPARMVNDPEQEAALGAGWADHPDKVVPEPEPEPELEPGPESNGHEPRPKSNRRYR